MATMTSTEEAKAILSRIKVVGMDGAIFDRAATELAPLIAEALDKAYTEGMEAQRLFERLDKLRRGDNPR